MRKILAAFLFIVVLSVVLSPAARAYEYRDGRDAPHPNSKYWRVTGRKPGPSTTTRQKHGNPTLLLEENELLKEQVRLLKEQIAILKQQRTSRSYPPPRAGYQPQHNGLRTLEQSVSTLDRALYSVRRTRALLQGF